MINSQFIEELKSLENQIPIERSTSLRTHFTRRHWHPFGQELLGMIYSCPEVDFGSIIAAIINGLSVDLDPFIIAELLGMENNY